MLRTTKPQAFTCLRNDLSSWLFSCSEMGGVCLLYMGCCCFFPSSLLEMFRAGGDLECRGERLSPHPHWFRKSHLYCGQPHKDVVGVGSRFLCFFLFLSPFIFCGQRLQPTTVFMVPSTAFSKHGLTQPLAFYWQRQGSSLQPGKLSH